MIRKSDLSWRIGMLMLVLCTALVLTVLPAAANYTADKPLTEYAKGTINGNMNYTIGNSTYSPKIWSNDTYMYRATIPETIQDGSTIVMGRLYVYWTWSFNDTNPSSGMYDTGVQPSMNVSFNGTTFTSPATSYVDWKNDATAGTQTTSYNYPSGTYCYNVTGLVSTGTVDSPVIITNTYGSDKNQSFNIQAVGLLTLYNSTTGTSKEYRIAEGNDVLYTKYKDGAWQDGITPTLATSSATLTDLTNSGNDATLISVAPSAGPNPAGGTVYNRLFFNSVDQGGIWDGNPRDYDFSYETTYVNVVTGTNTVGFRDGVDDTTYTTDLQMQAANAFLLNPL